jgi:hypothetical protein
MTMRTCEDVASMFGATHCVSQVFFPFESVTQFVTVTVTVAFGSGATVKPNIPNAGGPGSRLLLGANLGHSSLQVGNMGPTGRSPFSPHLAA